LYSLARFLPDEPAIACFDSLCWAKGRLAADGAQEHAIELHALLDRAVGQDLASEAT